MRAAPPKMPALRNATQSGAQGPLDNCSCVCWLLTLGAGTGRIGSFSWVTAGVPMGRHDRPARGPGGDPTTRRT